MKTPMTTAQKIENAKNILRARMGLCARRSRVAATAKAIAARAGNKVSADRCRAAEFRHIDGYTRADRALAALERLAA